MPYMSFACLILWARFFYCPSVILLVFIFLKKATGRRAQLEEIHFILVLGKNQKQKEEPRMFPMRHAWIH